MKRSSILLLAALLAFAQRSRDDYRAAYRAWREADPNIERDAFAGGASIAQRADRLAAEAAKCAAARKAFLEGMSGDEAQQIAWLETPLLRPEPASLSTEGSTQFVTAETSVVTRTIDMFASDPDKGIQQVRQALARERAALDALGLAIAQRQKARLAANIPAQAIEQTRVKALEQSRAMLQGVADAAGGTAREAAAWAEYYRKLGEAARGSATPITSVPAGVATVTLNNPVPAPPTITPVPLARYVGAWMYPQTNGLYHGPQPESIDVVVIEEDGHVKGTVLGRFKVASGDPILRCDFSGDFQSTRNQVFKLVANDGAKGTIELIPGPAFNLLEVNIQIEAKQGKIRQADVVLVKK